MKRKKRAATSIFMELGVFKITNNWFLLVSLKWEKFQWTYIKKNVGCCGYLCILCGVLIMFNYAVKQTDFMSCWKLQTIHQGVDCSFFCFYIRVSFVVAMTIRCGGSLKMKGSIVFMVLGSKCSRLGTPTGLHQDKLLFWVPISWN